MSRPIVKVRESWRKGRYEVRLTIDHQTFTLQSLEPTKKKCEWQAKMLRIAFRRLKGNWK